jgi:hypothetical protein
MQIYSIDHSPTHTRAVQAIVRLRNLRWFLQHFSSEKESFWLIANRNQQSPTGRYRGVIHGKRQVLAASLHPQQ